jgi:hypothetical protein
MAEYGTRDWYEGSFGRLDLHLERGEFSHALQVFIENKEQIPAFRRRLYFAYIQDGLSGHKTYRRLIKTAIAMIVVNMLIQPLFSLQVLDAFAFLANRYFYYNYIAASIPQFLNIGFLISLAYQWYEWVALPGKFFRQKVPPAYLAGYFAIIALVSVYTAAQIIPLAKDLPIVWRGGYYTRTISYEEQVAMVYGELILHSGREDVARTLRQELRDSFGFEYPDDDFPLRFVRLERRLGRDAYLIYLDAEKAYYPMSALQYRATTYREDIYPIVIKYLRQSKIILRIDNE